MLESSHGLDTRAIIDNLFAIELHRTVHTNSHLHLHFAFAICSISSSSSSQANGLMNHEFCPSVSVHSHAKWPSSTQHHAMQVNTEYCTE